MNIPKAIRSLKSNGFLSISTTPILCRIEVSHPATRLFLSIYYHIGQQAAIIKFQSMNVTCYSFMPSDYLYSIIKVPHNSTIFSKKHFYPCALTFPRANIFKCTFPTPVFSFEAQNPFHDYFSAVPRVLAFVLRSTLF